MSSFKRKRSISLFSKVNIDEGKAEVVDDLDSKADSNASELCYGCGTNLKKRKLTRHVIDFSFDPPRAGKFPIFIQDPKEKNSESLCPHCYDGVRDVFEKSNRVPVGGDSSTSTNREFIGDNSVRTWCSRVIVSVSLLISLVAFFVGAKEKLGAI